jgi:hypothetical protein
VVEKLNKTGQLIIEKLAPYLDAIRIISHIDGESHEVAGTANTPAVIAGESEAKASKTKSEPVFYAVGDVRVEDVFSVEVRLNIQKMHEFSDSSAARHPAVKSLLGEGTHRTVVSKLNEKTGDLEMIPEKDQVTEAIPSIELLAAAVSNLFPKVHHSVPSQDEPSFSIKAHAVGHDYHTGKAYDGFAKSQAIVDGLSGQIVQRGMRGQGL